MASKLTVGEIYDGKVIKTKPFGALVSIPAAGGALGLVHISQIANGFIENVDDIVAVDDEVVVRVLSIDESNKVSLSMKDLPQPKTAIDEDGEEYTYIEEAPVVITPAQAAAFEERLKSWQKLSSDRIAGINRRNKRRK